jgi:hypothetical protein
MDVASVSAANGLIEKINSSWHSGDHDTFILYSERLLAEFGKVIPANVSQSIGRMAQAAAQTCETSRRDRLTRLLLQASGPASGPASGLDVPLSGTDRYDQIMFSHLGAQDYDQAYARETHADAIRQCNLDWWDGRRPINSIEIKPRRLGDFIQFSRFFDLLAERVRKVHIKLDGRTAALARRMNNCRSIDIVVAGDVPRCDAALDIMAIPAALGVGRSGIAPLPAYIHPDEPDVELWRQIVRKAGGPYVGLIWSAWGPTDPRSVNADLIRELIEETPASFICLQANYSKFGIVGIDNCDNFHDFGIYNLESTACLMRIMDLVIVPDCGMAHFSSALGAETFVMAKKDCHFTWNTTDGSSLWYDTARVFRQVRTGDWRDVKDKVGRAMTGRERRPSGSWR